MASLLSEQLLTLCFLLLDLSMFGSKLKSRILWVDQSFTCFMLGLPFLSSILYYINHQILQTLEFPKPFLNQLLHGSLTPGCLCAGSTHVIRIDCVMSSNLINHCSCLNASFKNLWSCLIFSQTIEELDVDCQDPAHHLVPYDTHYSPDASCVWLKLLQVLDWFVMVFSYDWYICFIYRWPKRIESRLIS